MTKTPSETSARKIRKDASENLRRAIAGLESVGDHGTAHRVRDVLKRLDERRAADNRAAGLS